MSSDQGDEHGSPSPRSRPSASSRENVARASSSEGADHHADVPTERPGIGSTEGARPSIGSTEGARPGIGSTEGVTTGPLGSQEPSKGSHEGEPDEHAEGTAQKRASSVGRFRTAQSTTAKHGRRSVQSATLRRGLRTAQSITPQGKTLAMTPGHKTQAATPSMSSAEGGPDELELQALKTQSVSLRAPDVQEIFQKYEEQPTMRGDIVMVKPTSKKAPAKRRGLQLKKRDISLDTVFENAEESKRTLDSEKRKQKGAKRAPGKTEETRAKEDEEKKKVGKEIGYKDLSIERDDDGAYENLPTPPLEQTGSSTSLGGDRKQAPQSPSETEMLTGHSHGRLSISADRRRRRDADEGVDDEFAYELGTQVATEKEAFDSSVKEDLVTGIGDIEGLEPSRASSDAARRDKKGARSKSQDTRMKTVLDILSIMCVLPLMNDYWVFPAQVVSNGGMAFVIIYLLTLLLLVHPTLCVVLFVSQYTRNGLVYVFAQYGNVFRGMAYGYMILIFFSQMSIIHHGSILLKHIAVVYDDSLSIGVCSELYVKHYHECSSVFLDAHCLTANSSFEFYGNGWCWKQPQNSERTTTALNSYIRYLVEPSYKNGIDWEIFTRYTSQLVVIGVLAAISPALLVTGLATLMVIFFIVIVMDNIVAFDEYAFDVLKKVTNYQALANIQLWMTAFRLAFSSSGLGEVAIFCMSSFRHPRGNYFTTATFVIIGRIVTSLLGLLLFLDRFAVIETIRPGHATSFSPKNSKDIVYYPAMMVDVYTTVSDFSNQLYDHAEFVFLYYTVSSLAALFTVLAVTRKQGAVRLWERSNFLTAYIVVCLLYSLLVSVELIKTFASKHRFLVVFTSVHLYAAITICTFTFFSGIFDYFMDIRELFSQKITTLRTLRETCQILALFFAVIVLLFLQVYDLIQIYSKEKEDIDRMIAQNHSWDLAQEYLAIILAFTPILIPLLASFYAYVFTKKEKLVCISEDHPAYRKRLKRAKLLKEARKPSKFAFDEEYKEVTAKDTADKDFPLDDRLSKSAEGVAPSKETMKTSKETIKSAEKSGDSKETIPRNAVATSTGKKKHAEALRGNNLKLRSLQGPKVIKTRLSKIP